MGRNQSRPACAAGHQPSLSTSAHGEHGQNILPQAMKLGVETPCQELIHVYPLVSDVESEGFAESDMHPQNGSLPQGDSG